jgi:hypothetical protein
MADRLDKLSSVEPDSLPGDNDGDANHDAQSHPGTAPGNQSGEDKSQKDTGGRTVDNVHGELTRKLDQQREYFTGVVSSLEQKIERLLEARSGGEPAKPTSQNSLDDLSLQDLRNIRPNVPKDQLAAFDEYVSERSIEEKVQSQVQAIQQQQQYAQAEVEANKQAVNRWPDLRDKSSAIYAKTNEILARMGDRADNDPRAVLNAANEAGIELGLAPRTVQGPRMTGVRHTAPGGTNAPPPDKASTIDEARLNEIAGKLGGAFKGGKISDEALERIRESTAIYRDNVDSLIK